MHPAGLARRFRFVDGWSTSRKAFLELLCVGVVASVICADALRSGIIEDTWWHLVAGRWVLAHGELVRHQIGFFSLPAGFSWHPVEWAYQVFLAAAVNVAGQAGFLVAGPLLLVAAMVTMWATLLYRGVPAGYRVAAIVLVVGWWVCVGTPTSQRWPP